MMLYGIFLNIWYKTEYMVYDAIWYMMLYGL